MRKNLLWAPLLALAMASPLAAQVANTSIIMTVNEEPVYTWEIGLMVPQVRSELAGRGSVPKQEEVVRTAVRRVVETRLLSQEARRRNLKSDDARVEMTMEQFEAQAGGRAGLNTALGRLGATYDQLRASVVEADLVQVFVETQIAPRVTVTDADVEAFYDANPPMFDRPDMVRARHILIRLTPNSTTVDKKEARTRAEAARRRVIDGEDFAKVASEVSEGREAANGGDMGFFAQDSMMPELTSIAFVLEIGQVSEIIETRFGFHILKVEEKRPASKMTYEEAKEPVRRLLTESKNDELVAELLTELRESATIVRNVIPSDVPANPNGG